MKGKVVKATKTKKPDPMRMKATDFDELMRHALGVPPEATDKKAAKKKARKKR